MRGNAVSCVQTRWQQCEPQSPRGRAGENRGAGGVRWQRLSSGRTGNQAETPQPQTSTKRLRNVY